MAPLASSGCGRRRCSPVTGNQPEVTNDVTRDGWYRTDDAGFRASNTRPANYHIINRINGMIVADGENVYSGGVEQAISKHPAVRSATVIGVPDERWGEWVKAADIIAHCRGLLAVGKVPKAVEFVETLPMTPTGKVPRRAVRSQYWPQGRKVA